LSRPIKEGDQETLPSPFLTGVEDLSNLPPVDSPKLVVSAREAASGLGRVAANVQVCGKNLPELWSGLTAEQGKYLEPVLAALEDWQRKPRLGDLAVDWPELWQILFPDDYLFSASQLETYAACPFRFFGKQVLRLEERETDSTRLHYGLLVHRVLQRYYTERRQGLAMTDRQPLTAVGQQDKARLVHLFREEWDRLDEGAVPPDLEKLFCCSGGVLDLFFEVMESIEGEPENFGNLATELELPRVLLGADKQGRPVFLTGKIDRVDGRRNDPALAIIIDYKTGRIGPRASLKTKMADGRMLQLPLYAAAAQMQHLDLKIIGGAYLHLSERKSQQETSPKNAIAAVGQLLAKGTEAGEDSFDLESARQLAIELAEGIRAGRFPLTRFPKGGEDTECTRFCLLRHACRHPAGYETPYG
jgi:ATP-dependent helicase/nuclease subunit B